MISKTAEYALRAMVCLAKQQPGTSLTNKQIAAATGIPLPYLSKVMLSLCRAGLISARRGRGGGLALTQKPENITILDIIEAVDPIKEVSGCPLKLKSHQTQLCPLHSRLNEATVMIKQAFSRTTLSEMITQK
ncbi:MAG TPA: Rrf2 family transcriptional regulator [Firmicutes bacterium]|nr:Rrf2 family transcriptional regulator [Bacillota bacterium]